MITTRLPGSAGAGQRGCFRRDAFLQVTVEAITKMLWSNGEVPGAASASNRPRDVALAVGEAHRGSQTLAEGAGGDLHTGGVAVFEVAGDLGVQVRKDLMSSISRP